MNKNNMNRQIKFKFWNKKNSRFLQNDNNSIDKTIFDLWDWVEVMGTCTSFPMGDYVFVQYTGLTDKNNNPIYEGDITIDTQKQKYEIIFDENHARYDLKVCGENKLSQTSYFTQIYEKKHIEVIGNIFEHPELLN
jgi:uncharacterized phage protein (TIGR01671 family)